MNVTVARVEDDRKFNAWGEEIISCGICGGPTTMTGTKRCDGCWELERRVRNNPELARKVLASAR